MFALIGGGRKKQHLLCRSRTVASDAPAIVSQQEYPLLHRLRMKALHKEHFQGFASASLQDLGPSLGGRVDG